MTAQIRYQRADYVDELNIDGESVVLLQSRAIRLGGLGPVILAVLGSAKLTVTEIVSAVTEQLGGAPADGSAEAVVESAIAALVDESLLIKVEN
ncbi:MAG: hypothetical protein V9E81_11175 [Marmoricola sp.]